MRDWSPRPSKSATCGLTARSTPVGLATTNHVGSVRLLIRPRDDARRPNASSSRSMVASAWDVVLGSRSTKPPIVAPSSSTTGIVTSLVAVPASLDSPGSTSDTGVADKPFEAADVNSAATAPANSAITATRSRTSTSSIASPSQVGQRNGTDSSIGRLSSPSAITPSPPGVLDAEVEAAQEVEHGVTRRRSDYLTTISTILRGLETTIWGTDEARSAEVHRTDPSSCCPVTPPTELGNVNRSTDGSGRLRTRRPQLPAHTSTRTSPSNLLAHLRQLRCQILPDVDQHMMRECDARQPHRRELRLSVLRPCRDARTGPTHP